jgi:hypothetical protein
LGPNESRAKKYIKDQALKEFATNEDKELINAAATSINRGKFQKLPREINKLIKLAASTKPSSLETYKSVINVLKSYPLLETISESEEKEKVVAKRIIKTEKPEIILSESFSI